MNLNGINFYALRNYSVQTQDNNKRRKTGNRPEEIDRALGKKENADIWLEGDKIVAEVY